MAALCLAQSFSTVVDPAKGLCPSAVLSCVVQSRVLVVGGPGDVRDSRLWRGAGCGGSGGGMEGAPSRRGRALGLAVCSGIVLRAWATGGGPVGRDGAGRLPLRAVSLAGVGAGGTAASGDGLVTTGESGWELTSESFVASSSRGDGEQAGGDLGGSSSTGAISLSLTSAGSVNIPETLKSISPGKIMSAFWMRASTTPTT